MKTMYPYTLLIHLLLIVTFTACDKNAHDNEYPLQEGEGAAIIGLQTETADTPVNNLTLYVFNDQGAMTLHTAYDDPRKLAATYLPIKAGSYTFIITANAPDMDAATPSDLTQYLKDHTDQFPLLLTASAQIEIKKAGIERVLLKLKKGTDGIDLSGLLLLLTLPGMEMPAYTTRATDAATAAWQLRCVVEVYKKGTETRVHRRALLPVRQADGRYPVELILPQGNYDLRLWTDYTDSGTADDRYYSTTDMKEVTLTTRPYTAGTATDTKDAHYATATVTLNGDNGEMEIAMERPFARYRLVAKDVEGYKLLIVKENYPPIEDLAVKISYEGYFPSAFNVTSGKPNNSLTGIGYPSLPVTADGYSPDKALQMGCDFVLTNGSDSFVTVTIEMLNKHTDKVVSRTTGIKIPYRRGCLTTITGSYLTAGRTTGGIGIDTEWGGEIIVPF